MFGADKIKSMVLNLIDETIGKKYKIVDEITDVFQGLEPDIKDLKNITRAHEDRLNDLSKRIKGLEKK